MAKVTATEFERQVFEREEIRIVLRCAHGEMFEPYPYQKRADKSANITEWQNTRVKPLVGDTEVDVIDGNGTNPHGRCKMETIRNSYADK